MKVVSPFGPKIGIIKIPKKIINQINKEFEKIIKNKNLSKKNDYSKKLRSSKSTHYIKPFQIKEFFNLRM